MAMKRLLLTGIAVLFLATGTAHAGNIPPPDKEAKTKKELNDKKEANENWFKHGIKIQELTRYVMSGKNIILYFEHALDLNCSPGEFDVRVVKYPEHGTVELVPANGLAAFPEDNPRSKCNGKKVKGINIIYKSSPEYAGPDNVHVMSYGESGLAFETHWKLNVAR
jgi:hypothetical protein